MSYTAPDIELAQLIRHRVACGFEDPQTVYEFITDVHPEVDEAIIDRLVDEAFEARVVAEKVWPKTTDCDRLDVAFDMLDEENAIVARHNFACCQSCGRDEIHDEIAETREAKRRVDGYVFYHLQDTDSAVTSGVLHLRYGGTAGTDDVDVAERIVNVLREVGLHPAWNGKPTSTIQVPLDWKRSHAPISSSSEPTAEACVRRWCEALPRATRSSAAELAGPEFPRALEAAGKTEAASAWARAPFDDGDRAVAMARLAVARKSPELLLEAWQLAPWDRRGTFPRMLVEAGVETAVFEIVRDKIEETRRDAFGGASAAWLFARIPGLSPARERAYAAWRQQGYFDDALLALAAGLWRAGDAEMGVEVKARFASTYTPWAHGVAIAGASTADDVLGLAQNLEGLAREELQRSACARLIELGAIEQARAYATATGEACEAYVAWQTGDHARIAEIAARSDEHALQYEEGLLTKLDVRHIRIAVAAATSDHAMLSAVAEEVCAEALAAAEPSVEPDGAALKAAIAKWQRDIPVRRRIAARHSGRTILVAAAAHARRGEHARAEELFAIMRAPFAAHDEPDYAFITSGFADEIVEAFVAMNVLDQIEELAKHTTLTFRALGSYIPALIAAGEDERALALLDNALSRALTRLDLLELMPAVLAVAVDAKDKVREARRAADESLAALGI